MNDSEVTPKRILWEGSVKMQLPVCAVFAWLTIVMFSLIPKRLSIFDFVFLYCVVLILTTMTFTALDVDLHIVTISRNPTISFATIISRIITIPMWIMMAVDALQFSGGRKPGWFRAIAIWLGLTVFDWVLDLLKVITYHKPFVWHALSTFITYFGFIVIAWGLASWYRRFDRKNVRQA